MPVNMQIEQDGHILFFEMIEPWTLGELDSVTTEMKQHLDSVEHTVYIVSDSTNVRTVPKGILRQRNSPAVTHANSGGVFIATTSTLARTFTNTIFKVAGYHTVHFYPTLEDARAAVAKKRAEEDKEIS